MSAATQVLKLYSEGKPIKSIGREIGLSEARVRYIVLAEKAKQFDKLVADGIATPLAAPNGEEPSKASDMNELLRIATGRGTVSDEPGGSG